MQKINRTITPAIEAALRRGKSVLLLGPRQVGKTTLLTKLPIDLSISLARPAIRQQYEQDKKKKQSIINQTNLPQPPQVPQA